MVIDYDHEHAPQKRFKIAMPCTSDDRAVLLSFDLGLLISIPIKTGRRPHTKPAIFQIALRSGRHPSGGNDQLFGLRVSSSRGAHHILYLSQ